MSERWGKGTAGASHARRGPIRSVFARVCRLTCAHACLRAQLRNKSCKKMRPELSHTPPTPSLYAAETEGKRMLTDTRLRAACVSDTDGWVVDNTPKTRALKMRGVQVYGCTGFPTSPRILQITILQFTYTSPFHL